MAIEDEVHENPRNLEPNTIKKLHHNEEVSPILARPPTLELPDLD